MNKICGIYKITNPSGKVYIGQSRNIKKRVRYYINKHSSTKRQIKIYASLKQYGWETHTFEIIEECSIEDLNCRERHWQDFYDVLNGGLNCVLVKCGDKVQEYPKEFGEAISKRVSGDKNPMYGKVGAMKGKNHTEETKKLIGDKQRRGLNHSSKIVLHLTTGIFYDCLKDAAEALDITYDRAKNNMRTNANNKINLVYV